MQIYMRSNATSLIAPLLRELCHLSSRLPIHSSTKSVHRNCWKSGNCSCIL